MTFQRVQRELSVDEIARLRALRAEGKRLKWLAHEFGISHQTVSRYLRRVGLAEELPEEWIEAVRAAEAPAKIKAAVAVVESRRCGRAASPRHL